MSPRGSQSSIPMIPGRLDGTKNSHKNIYRQGYRQKLFLLLRQAIAEAERQRSFRQKSGIQLQDSWVKFQISAHSFSASLPQLYPAEDRIINEATPWQIRAHGFNLFSSKCFWGSVETTSLSSTVSPNLPQTGIIKQHFLTQLQLQSASLQRVVKIKPVWVVRKIKDSNSTSRQEVKTQESYIREHEHDFVIRPCVLTSTWRQRRRRVDGVRIDMTSTISIKVRNC